MAKIIPINGYKKQRRESYSPDEKQAKENFFQRFWRIFREGGGAMLDLTPVTIWEIHPDDERSLDLYE